MGGTNPFIQPAGTRVPERAFRIVYRDSDGGTTSVDVDPARLPYTRDGLPGSLLEIALGHDVAIDHACGGVCACSTCHVVVREGLESCSEATDDELDQLDKAPGLTPKSRLACQCVPDGTRDLVIEIPAWNRNLVRETHH
jgi:2Fe-2S ferredoxin